MIPSDSFLLEITEFPSQSLKNMMNNKITIASRLTHTKFGYVEANVCNVIELIKSGDMLLKDPQCGDYTLMDITTAIRKESSSQQQNMMKERYLPVVFFNGVWDGARICKYSNITAIDFDDIYTDEQLSQTIGLLKSAPFVYAIFRTFKLRRIKALVTHNNTDPSRHKEMYNQIVNVLGASGYDTSCKDLSRKTFLAWDEDIWVNPNCSLFQFTPKAQVFNPVKPNRLVNTGKSKSPQSIINILNSSWRNKHPEYWKAGNRANSIFKCTCQLCEYGVPEDMAEEYFLNGGWSADDFTDDEVLKHVRGAYRTNQNSFGTKTFQ